MLHSIVLLFQHAFDRMQSVSALDGLDIFTAHIESPFLTIQASTYCNLSIGGSGTGAVMSLTLVMEPIVDSSSENEEALKDVVLMTFSDRFFQLDRTNKYRMIVLETE